MRMQTLEDLSMVVEDLAVRGRILVVDDEPSIRYTFSHFLEEEGYQATAVPDPRGALDALAAGEVDLAFVDILLESSSGIDLMAEIKKRSPSTEVVIVTGAPSIETASDALRLGAFDYLVKPVDRDGLLQATDVALRHKAVRDAVERYRLNLEAIFRSLEDGIVTVDRTQSIVELNDAAERLCGLRRREVLGKPLTSEVLDCSGACLEALRRTVTGTPPVVIHNLECRAAHRPEQVVNVKATPLVRGYDGPSGAVLVIRDQTRLEGLERTLRRCRPGGLVGESPAIRAIRATVESLTELPATVLVTGEAGSGKEVVSCALHAAGRRRPLLKLHCSTLTDELLERELFGHVQDGPTTGRRVRAGLFELARGGTLFVDEIADMPVRIQGRFLRTLETMEIERVGEPGPIPVDVRVIATTARDLERQVARGLFRADLYSRLKTFEIHVPPLRERPEDVAPLVLHLLRELGERFDKRVTAVSDAALERLLGHPWPGNVRELEQVLEHALVRAESETVTREDLPAALSRDGARS